MNTDKSKNVQNGVLIPLLLLVLTVSTVFGAYVYLENASLRRSNELILTSLASLEKEVKSLRSIPAEKNNTVSHVTATSVKENTNAFADDMAKLNHKFAELAKLVEAQTPGDIDAPTEQDKFVSEQEYMTAEDMFINEYTDDVDTDVVKIKDNISNEFFHKEMDGVEFNSIECRARSCRVDLKLSKAEMKDLVQDNLSAQIGRSHMLQTSVDENGNYHMYFSVDEES